MVQMSAEVKEERTAGTLHAMCMLDLKATSHVLEAAVATVAAAAAAQTGQQAPSAELVSIMLHRSRRLAGCGLCNVAGTLHGNM